MLPDFVPLTDASVSANAEYLPDKTYSFNPDNGRIGSFVSGIAAVKQAIYKLLLTPRGHCPVYGSSYGSELWRLRGQSMDYVTAMLPVYIRDALYRDDRVIQADSFAFSSEGDKLLCSFTVHTVNGRFTAQARV